MFLVDDNRDDVMSFALLLRYQFGCEVESCTNPRECLDIAAEWKSTCQDEKGLFRF